MSLETRVWGNKSTPNLFTTVPRMVRDQLGLGAQAHVAWRLDGSTAELRRAEPPEGNVLYKQARSNSLYVAIPVAVAQQLRVDDRSRIEWELLGSSARVRRG